MLAYRVKQLGSGPWIVKLGVTTLSQWPSRQEAVSSAIERAEDYWSRTPTRFREIAVIAPDDEGVERIVWTARDPAPN